MKTIKQVEITPIFVQFIPEELEEGKLYISREYKVAVHNCLCGCKSKTVTPLNEGGWTLIERSKKLGDNDVISLTPSIANYQIPCKSHYIITNNKANFV